MTGLLDTASARLNDAIAAGQLRGAVLAVADRHSILETRALGGVAGSSEAAPLRIDDRFLWTSVTKVLTTVQVLRLVEQGQLGLGVPVAEYLPAFGCNGKDRVTTWHLLTHTSGMVQDANTVERSTPGMTAADHLGVALRAGLHFVPGERVEYCSPPFWVLAELIRQLSGRSHVEDVQRTVTDPCGMPDTRYETGDDVAIVPAYGAPDPSLPDQQRRLAYPAGALVGTAGDLAHFGQALLNEGRTVTGARLLAPISIARACQPQTDRLPGNPVGTSRGLGVVVGGPGTLRSSRTVGHGGASGTYFWVDPEHELVIVFLSAHWGLPRRLLASVADSIIAERSMHRLRLAGSDLARGERIGPDHLQGQPAEEPVRLGDGK
ncbi:MAG: beta-lactamase family protein [Chloroflexi bacterium]|nr:beta-lactamase family protein [Chloroflexota bacterium]